MEKTKTIFKQPTMEFMLPKIYDTERLSAHIYTYCNYEKLMNESAETGFKVKESKEFYEFHILRFIRTIFEDKSQEEIRMFLNSFDN